MARWIAFDEESTAIAAAESGMAVSFQRGDALESALATSKPAIVLLPGETNAELVVIELRPGLMTNRSEVAPPGQDSTGTTPEEQPFAYEASGFLGLSDEPVFEPEPVTKKKWWKRLTD
jgi:hypothetical protein